VKTGNRLHTHRWHGAREGSSTVEFAIVVPLFFILTFGLLDFGRLFYTQMTLQHALRQAGRYAITGNHLPDPTDPTKTLLRVDSIRHVARQAAIGLITTDSDIQICSQSGGIIDCSSTAGAGGPGATVTISLTTHVQLITPLIGRYFGDHGVYTFTVRTQFRNEPFPVGSTV
jgi:Flp pilus assembly protein TadG